MSKNYVRTEASRDSACEYCTTDCADEAWDEAVIFCLISSILPQEKCFVCCSKSMPVHYNAMWVEKLNFFLHFSHLCSNLLQACLNECFICTSGCRTSLFLVEKCTTESRRVEGKSLVQVWTLNAPLLKSMWSEIETFVCIHYRHCCCFLKN